MEHASELRKIVAEFLELDAEAIGPDTRFEPALATSLSRAGLDAALRRRLGIQCAAVYSARRFGELEAAVLGLPNERDASSVDAAGDARAVHATSGNPTQRLPIGCGIDIVELKELPKALDYWEHEFYRHVFTDAEIAYCVAFGDPREHFAVRWAAKEALKKASGSYVTAELKDLDVCVEAGAPYIRWRGAALPVAVSLSHAESAAVAIVIDVAQPAATAEQTAPADRLPAPSQPTPPSHPAHGPLQRRSAWMTMLLIGVIALWALLRTFDY